MHKEESSSDHNITKELFLKWRSPRFGDKNPTCFDNKVWKWLINSKINAYQANEEMNGPSPLDRGPCWCFNRFGQSKTITLDGRTIFIGGEHEDNYDPDFYIYNDVIVVNSNGLIEIYGYPQEIFPQTDFHSATLVDGAIIIIGNLGYPENRRVGETHVFSLNINNYEIEEIETIGENPGWIHDHSAVFNEKTKSIIIKNGKIDFGEDQPLLENIDKWDLCLKTKKWTRLSKNIWTRWIVRKHDWKMNHLSDLRSALWHFEVKWMDNYQEDIRRLTLGIGKEPDLSAIKSLYNPEIPHIQLPEIEDEYNVYRIEINGTVVRYVEDMYHVLVTVEGSLPNDIIKILQKDLVKKLSNLENTEYVIKDIKIT